MVNNIDKTYIMKKNNSLLIWIDLEMTGLDVKTCKIMEIATIITDINLRVVAEGPSITIKNEKYVLDKMDDWNTRQHKKSGLYDKSLNSNIICQMAEKKVLIFLKQHIEKNVSPMCGNSIHQDRIFLKKYMPELESFFQMDEMMASNMKIVLL